MVQGVREVFEIVDLDNDGGGGGGRDTVSGKLVFIGKGLEGGEVGRSLDEALGV